MGLLRLSSSMPKLRRSAAIGRPPSMLGVWSHSLQGFTTCTCASTGSPLARANRVQVHRLEHHCPSTDDRVQPDPASRESTDWPWWLLEALGWHCCHACLRLRWRPRQWIHGSASLWVWPAGLSSSSRSLLGSLLRHLAQTTCQKPSSSLSTTCVSS